MATVITAGNATNGLSLSADNFGTFEFKTGTGAGTTAMALDASQNLSFNSGYGSVAAAYGCRAWVNFNGTGTVAIRASGNVTSITDNGVGDYTVNFTTEMPDVNFASFVTSVATSYSNISNANTTTSIRIIIVAFTGASLDSALVSAAIFR
jgi:hypothetical protein